MVRKPLDKLLVLQTALDYLLKQGDIPLSGDKPKDNELSKLLTLGTVLEHYIQKQSSYPGSHIPPEKRFYHSGGRYKGPRGGDFSEIGVDVTEHGEQLPPQQLVSEPKELEPGEMSEVTIISPDEPDDIDQVIDSVKQSKRGHDVPDEIEPLIDELNWHNKKVFDTWAQLHSEVENAHDLANYFRTVDWSYRTVSEIQGSQFGNDFNTLKAEHPDLFNKWIAPQEYKTLVSLMGYSQDYNTLYENFMEGNPGAQLGYPDERAFNQHRREENAVNERRIKLLEGGRNSISDEAIAKEGHIGVRMVASLGAKEEDFSNVFTKISKEIENLDIEESLEIIHTTRTTGIASQLADKIMSVTDSKDIIGDILDRYSDDYVDFNAISANLIRNLSPYMPSEFIRGGNDVLGAVLKHFDNWKWDMGDDSLDELMGGDKGAAAIRAGRRRALHFLGQNPDVIPHFEKTGQLLNPETWTADLLEFRSGGDPYQKKVNLIEHLADITSIDPSTSLVYIIDELYLHTGMGWLHVRSKGDWEASSDTPFGGVLKEVVGDLLDGKVIYHQGDELDPGSKPGDRQRPETVDVAMRAARNKAYRYTNQEQLEKYVLQQKALTRQILDLAYPDDGDVGMGNDMQWDSKAGEFILYRGVMHNDLWEAAPDQYYRMADLTSNVTDQNPISSWSLREGLAERFAGGPGEHETEYQPSDERGVVLTTKVRKDDIWSIFATHAYNGNEREFIVINQPDVQRSNMLIRAVRKPESRETGEARRQSLELAGLEEQKESKVISIESGGNADWLRYMRDWEDKERREITETLSEEPEEPEGPKDLSKLLALEMSVEYLIKKNATNTVLVGDVSVPIELSTDPAKGLSGRGSLNPGTGMFFIMADARDFWMKDMQFPLDIIWINDKREVVDISENLPIPISSNIPFYSPKEPATYVLEINGGEAKALGINIGDAVEINIPHLMGLNNTFN